MSITLIAAMDRNRTIGVGNRLPWRLPAEMAYFKQMTTGKTVLMGRKTFDSLRGPLQNRKNVILTRQQGLAIEGCEIVHSVEEVLERYGQDELMVIGGAEIYSLMLPAADTVLLTDVEAEIEGGDAFFPPLPEDEWKVIDSEFRPRDEKNMYNFTFRTYKRMTT